MCAGIGLLSILIVAALCFYLTFGTKSHPGYDATVLEQGKTAKQEAAQIAGRTEDAVPIDQTFKMEEVDVNGQFRRLKVVSIVPLSPMENVYKLKVNDEIISADQMGVADNANPDLGKDLVTKSYQDNQPLVVLRDGQQITLNPTASPLSKAGAGGLLQGQIPSH